MIRLGKASIPLDLMNFAPEDAQPSIFFLKEDDRQSHSDCLQLDREGQGSLD